MSFNIGVIWEGRVMVAVARAAIKSVCDNGGRVGPHGGITGCSEDRARDS